MNRVSKAKLVKLEEQCAAALRDKARQSVTVWRGEMWAIIAAAHELRKRGLLELPPSADAVDPHVDSTGKPTTREKGIS
jgi:hypothetical protein